MSKINPPPNSIGRIIQYSRGIVEQESINKIKGKNLKTEKYKCPTCAKRLPLDSFMLCECGTEIRTLPNM